MIQDFCFHIHTLRCGHADKTMSDADIARSFYEAGFRKIAFTDHNPWKTFLDDKPNHAMRWDQKEDYLNSIHSLADQYKGKMEIITGFELEYLPDHKAEMDELQKDSELFLIGQHFTRGADGEYISMHKKGYVPNDYEMDFYASCLENACKDGYADILVHPDLFMIHKTEFDKKDAELAHRICETAIKYDVPLEINLCQISEDKFFKHVDINYPCRGFWNVAKDYKDLKVIYGLDFHGHFPAKEMDGVITLANNIIGQDIISQLHFVSL